MPTYYETLNLASTATDKEIQFACDKQYQYWQQELAGKSPQAISRAQTALRQLDQIRATLTDQRKRAEYDSSIATTSDLADPLAIFRSVLPTPRAPSQKPVPQATSIEEEVPVTPWTCPKCHNENPATSNFCYMCGAQLLRECPECETLTSSIVTGFCNKCGLQFNAAQRRVEITGLAQQLAQQIERLEAKIPPIKQRQNGAGIFSKLFLFVLLLNCPLCLMFQGTSASQFILMILVLIAIVNISAFFLLVVGLMQNQQFKARQSADLRTVESEISACVDHSNNLQQEYAQLGKPAA